MFITPVSAVALLAIAGQAAASEPVPYRPLMKMSVHDLFGVNRRQSSGYQPTQTVCGTGATCAEACGAGYVTCNSNDGQTHCYDPAVQQTCCPDGSGNSCDAGYYCTQDTQQNTWCCPDGQTLAQCAAAYSITGSLVSETAAATSAAPSSAITSASYGGNVSVTTDIETDTTTVCPSASATLSYGGSNSTVTSPTQSVVTVPFSAATLSGPSSASALVVFAAAAIFAALF